MCYGGGGEEKLEGEKVGNFSQNRKKIKLGSCVGVGLVM